MTSDSPEVHRVLVVDDEPYIVDVITMALRFQGIADGGRAPLFQSPAQTARERPRRCGKFAQMVRCQHAALVELSRVRSPKHPARRVARPGWALAGLAALAALAGACRGAPQPEATGPQMAASTGREVFLSQCQGCHALGALGSRRPAGGDLAGYSMTPAEVASYARVMPTPRPLTQRELGLVARFVSEGQRRKRAALGDHARPMTTHPAP